MIALNFWIKPMTAEQELNTLLYHTARGLARYVTTSGNADKSHHPVALSYVLGLGTRLEWYRRPASELQTALCQRLLRTLAARWQGSLVDCDLTMIGLRIGCLPDSLHEQCILLMEDAIFVPKEVRIMQMNDKIPADVMDKLNMGLASLEKALLEKDPMMPQHLRNTHSLLISYPETVHLLEDREIALIIDAAEVHTKTEIVKAAAKGKGAGSKKKIDVGDL